MEDDKLIELVLSQLNEFKKDLSDNVKTQIAQIHDYVKDLKKDFSDKFYIFEDKVIKIYNTLHDNESKIHANKYDISNIKKEMVEAFRKIRNSENKQKELEKKYEFEKINDLKKDVIETKKNTEMSTKLKIIIGTSIVIGNALLVYFINIITNLKGP